MLWCFGGVAVLLVLLGLAALTIRPLRVARGLRPLPLLRGCLAISCLLLAAGCIGVGLLLP